MPLISIRLYKIEKIERISHWESNRIKDIPNQLTGISWWTAPMKEIKNEIGRFNSEMVTRNQEWTMVRDLPSQS